MSRHVAAMGIIFFLISGCSHMGKNGEIVYFENSPEFQEKSKVFAITPRQACQKMHAQYNTSFMPTGISIVGNYYLINRARKVEAPIGKAYLVDGFTGKIIPINSDIYFKNGMKIDLDKLIDKAKDE